MSTRLLKLAVMALALVVGWVFIAWVNRFHITPALVFVMLAYMAVVIAIYNLWRVGAALAGGSDQDGDGEDSFGRPLGRIDELDREKRTLLKAIKEAEFDLAMGKLSPFDAEQMIKMYRLRAIDVIKEIERLEVGEAGSVRERIEREVKARLEVEGKQKQQQSKTDAKQGKGKKGKESKDSKDAKAAAKSEEPAKPVEVPPTQAPDDEPVADKVEAKPESTPEPKSEPVAAKAEPKDDAEAKAESKTEAPAKAADDVVAKEDKAAKTEEVVADEMPPPKAAKTDSKEAAS